MEQLHIAPVRPFADLPPDDEWTQHVNHALKHYASMLNLSRSPLANGRLVGPALVRDAVSPTADERGSALRLVLQWAVGCLAPDPPAYTLGTARPYDDPTWRDPRWWRYNILRHRYLEPLHPDDFVEGGRYTETLIALTGVPSSDTYFEERNRAVREVAAWLRQQLATGTADDLLRQRALEETLHVLQRQPAAQAVLGIAATFDSVFPRALLLQIAGEERTTAAPSALEYLTAHRLLLTDNLGADLWLSPVLQAYLYERQPVEQLQRRHHYAARHASAAGDALAAAAHWQRAGQWAQAARALLVAATELVNDLRSAELCEALERFPAGQLAPADWQAVKLLLCDLALQLGRREQALSACRQALKATRIAHEQARIYRRMGKLYEQHNQLHALGYYRQAEECFDAGDVELLTMLKDRAWLHILRREWASAEADLSRALAQLPPVELAARADLLDALSNLHRRQQQFERAEEFARRALVLREELGNLPRIADSFNNLGVLYNAMDEHSHALAAFDEALAIFRNIGNQERRAGVLLNIGMAHHLAGRRRQAIKAYTDCLQICNTLELRLINVLVLYNLAEAHLELGEIVEAEQYWQTGHQLALAAAFDDEVRDFEGLRTRFPAPQQVEDAQPKDVPLDLPSTLDPVERIAVAVAAREGQVTPKLLMAAASVSKATATRRLAELARRGYLLQQGQGRSTLYLPVAHEQRSTSIAQRIREQLNALTATYGITTLGVGGQALLVIG